jgi:putative transposase
VDYIHYNPVVKRPIDWPFSSLHRYVQTAVLPEYWANGLAVEDITRGEW